MKSRKPKKVLHMDMILREKYSETDSQSMEDAENDEIEGRTTLHVS